MVVFVQRYRVMLVCRIRLNLKCCQTSLLNFILGFQGKNKQNGEFSLSFLRVEEENGANNISIHQVEDDLGFNDSICINA